MTRTIGKVEFLAVLDGKGMPKQAEKIGKDVGSAAGHGYDEEWTKAFRATLSKSGKESFDAWSKSGDKDGDIYGRIFTKRLEGFIQTAAKSFEGIRMDEGFIDNFAKGFASGEAAVVSLNQQLDALQGKVDGRYLNAARRQVDEWAASNRDATAAVQQATEATERRSQAEAEFAQHLQASINLNRVMDQMARASKEADWSKQIKDAEILDDRIRKLGSSVGGMSVHWRDLSHNTRQWTLIIGAVLAGMQEIAVLGSAAGGGLIALGGAATSGVIGIGGLAAVLVTLNKDLDELPASLQSVTREFQNFTPVFGQLREAIATGAFSKMPGVFDGLGSSVSALTPVFEDLGRSIGDTFVTLESSVRPGTKAFDEMARAVENAGPQFESLASSTGTFGVALLRAFNEGQPVVEGMIGYIDLLANRFDDFTQSNGFDEWMSNTMTIAQSLGPLLDAVGRSLNDLVTPDSVARTADFLDNLTAFMPNLTKFLDILGRLDVFGLIAQGLNEFGQAMEPLAAPAAELADALNRLLSLGFEAFGGTLTGVASAIAPFAQVMADLLGSMPPDMIAGIAHGLVILGAAMVTFKAGAAITGAINGIPNLLLGMGDAAEAAGGKMQSFAQKSARVFTGVAAGAAGFGILVAALDNVANTADRAAPRINEMTNALNGGGGVEVAFSNAAVGADSLAESLELVAGNGFDAIMERAGETAGAMIGVTGEVTHARDGFASLDATLAAMVGSGNSETAAEQFRIVAEQAASQGIEVDALTALFPGYMDAVAGAGGASAETGAQFGELSGIAITTGETIDDLAERIRGFGSQTLTTRDAAREFESSLDDVEAALAENGATLDITTDAGRRNESALDDLAGATFDLAAATVEQTGKQSDANAVIQRGRDDLIRMATQFGMTEEQANAYADELGLIPGSVDTKVNLNDGAARSSLNKLITDFNGRVITIRAVTQRDGAESTGPGRSMGGAAYGPGTTTSDSFLVPMSDGEHIWSASEVTAAGGHDAMAEMRAYFRSGGANGSLPWLDALSGVMSSTAQSTTSSRPHVTFAEGSIVVMGVEDPFEAANEVMQQVAKRIGS